MIANITGYETFLQRALRAETWDEIAVDEWEEACDFAGIKYEAYDDPDELVDDMIYALAAMNGDTLEKTTYSERCEYVMEV